MWWHQGYLFRRNLRVSNTFEDAQSGHMIVAPVVADLLYEQGKVRGDFQDIEVVYQTDAATPVLSVLPRAITDDGIIFPLQEDLEEGETDSNSYFVYHGNYSLDSAPVRPTYTEDFWPVEKPHDDAHFSYTRPGDWWKDGVSNQKGAVTTIRTSGERLRVVSNVGVNKGMMEVSVDGGVWTDIDLFSVDTGQDTVYEVTNLTSARHRVQLRVTGKKNPSASSEEVNIVRVEYQIPIVVTDLGEEIRDFEWSSIITGV